ncbi:MAG: acetate kinase [Clostridia bacterium]
MKILVVNAGSSSLKYQIIDMTTEKVLGKGQVDRIGSPESNLVQNGNGEKIYIEQFVKDHREAFKLALSAITHPEKGIITNVSEVGAIGHRVVHSGETFTASTRIDEDALIKLNELRVIGPLHMPPTIECIEGCLEYMPNIPNIAVFDTVFHSTMPPHAYMYAIKYEDYEKYKVRKYGFHGTSHKYVATEAIKYLHQPHSKIITCHLGNGSSLAAVVDGKCVDTSMGFTPLEGLIMGSRSGDLDPAVVTFLAEQKKQTAAQITEYLNKYCGFKGIAGVSDFRDLENNCAAGDERACLAIDMFAYRIKKYIGSYFAIMGGLDCIVFTGGIGENASHAREKIMQGLECLGIDFDFDKNSTIGKGNGGELHKPTSKVKVLIIPTNEELVIARDAKELAI